MGPEDGQVSSGGDQRLPILAARGLVKRFGGVVALASTDLELYPGEVLGIIGDNGAGKSSLVKCLTGAMLADEGDIELEGRPVLFARPQDAQAAGIKTVYQSVAVPHAGDTANHGGFGRDRRHAQLVGTWLRLLERSGIRRNVGLTTHNLGIVANIAQGFGGKVVILDEPTAALGVNEARAVLKVVKDLRAHGVPVIMVSHNMSHVFEVADRIHIQRLGRRVAVVTPQTHTMAEAVAIMTGAVTVGDAA
ncbi:MAG: ABC transporter ATP-binding protein [Ilumatobacteraceae bacterium]